jgi:hypothetical protein
VWLSGRAPASHDEAQGFISSKKRQQKPETFLGPTRPCTDFPVTSLTVLPLSPALTPATVAFSRFLKSTKQSPTPGPLHWPFPFPGSSSPCNPDIHLSPPVICLNITSLQSFLALKCIHLFIVYLHCWGWNTGPHAG